MLFGFLLTGNRIPAGGSTVPNSALDTFGCRTQLDSNTCVSLSSPLVIIYSSLNWFALINVLRLGMVFYCFIG